MTPAGARLLDPALLARLERLQLAARKPLVGQMTAEQRSPRHGSSVDFADYRPYHQGDDFRRIDYALYARLDVLLVRLYEAEEDLWVRLLVDTSQSMATGGKLDQAVRVAAALGFVALSRRDPVTVHTFRDDVPVRRFAGRHASVALFDHLASLSPGGPTPFARAANHLLARSGPPGLTLVVSDLLTPEWRDGLARLPARGGDVTVVHVLAEEDLRPSFLGDLDLLDAETAARVPVSLNADALAAYRRTAEAWADEVADRCRAGGLGYVRVEAGEPLEPLLLGAWRTAGVLR